MFFEFLLLLLENIYLLQEECNFLIFFWLRVFASAIPFILFYFFKQRLIKLY
ncbi:hypothetical protein BafHLJ01_0921 [Borreliella afzelii HLJ01]|nr:hypothetical protein BafHLJ01_0921 [Borreliella afzelii HLJ01]